jgi:hypothetical protein
LPVGPTDAIVPSQYGLGFAMICNATIYDATYSWKNGSFNGFTNLTKSNNSVAQIVNVPQQLVPGLGYSYFVSGATVSIFSPTVQAMAQKLADTYSSTFLGLVAGSFIGTQNIDEQIRTPLIAANVPYAPFYTLIILNFFCAVIGLIIAVLAISNKGASGVTSLLSPWGVTAQAFESVPENVVVKSDGDLFQESREFNANVVGVERVGTSNNWRFRVWQANGA